MEEEYRKLREGWVAGDRHRERALHLLFLSWWHWAEPEFLTGLSDDPGVIGLWHEIFAYFGGETSSDAEFLFVTAIMADITPHELGDAVAWEAAARRLHTRSRHLNPDAFSPEVFEGRGEYGKYFAHQSRVQAAWSRSNASHRT